MNNALNTKIVPIVFSEAIVDNAAFTTTEIDTLGFNRATIYVRVGTTDVAVAAFHVTQSDTAGSGHVEIAETDFTDATQADIGGTALAVPSATDDDKFWIVDVDLRGRKRYLDLVLTAGDGTAGTWAHAFCILSEPENGRNTAAEMGAAAVVSV